MPFITAPTPDCPVGVVRLRIIEGHSVSAVDGSIDGCVDGYFEGEFDGCTDGKNDGPIVVSSVGE